MMPDGGILSTTPVPGQFLGARGLPVSNLIDFEDGGIAIQDPSQGLFYQVWRARVIDSDIHLGAPNTPEFIVYAGAGEITEISLTFDQNMRPAIAFVESGNPKFLWYDSIEQEQVITDLDPDVQTPRVALDDKRSSQFGVSDVFLAYKREGRLYYRQQRDRYLTELDPTENMDPDERDKVRALIASGAGLIKIGMSRQMRMQFMFSYG